MILISKHCNKLRHVKLQINLLLTDNGLLNGLFTHCSHLESLHLENCFDVTGSFLAILPQTVKRLAFVSVSFSNFYCFYIFKFISSILILFRWDLSERKNWKIL